MIYDYLLTLSSEIELFWRWNFSGAAVLFFSIRYYALFDMGIHGVINWNMLVSTLS